MTAASVCISKNRRKDVKIKAMKNAIEIMKRNMFDIPPIARES